MKEIKLTQGKFAMVDDEDFEFLNQFKWCANKCNGIYYAVRIICKPKRECIKMHRIIINAPKILMVDHIDHNGINNQKSNLRLCTHSQNQMNRTSNGKSKYLGVSIIHDKKGYKYINSQIRTQRGKVHIGSFKTEEDAARAYDEMAKIHHGEFANLNFK